MKEDFFGKNYFDSGKLLPGAFKYYMFEDYYPYFKTFCYLIKKHFNPKRVLDVGCAKGFLVYAFRETGIEAYGVDISGYAISCPPADVQRYLYKIDLDRDSLPFENDYFDFITFFGTIEYLHNHRHAINEIKRVLVKGGSLLMTTVYKRVKDDAFRINVHKKTYWVKEFGGSWKISKIYYNFLDEYYHHLFTYSPITSYKLMIGKLLYERSRSLDRRIFIRLCDVLTTLNVLTEGFLLLSLKEKPK